MIALSATQTLTAFNLICSVVTTLPANPRPIVSDPVRVELRVDLDGRQFCQDDCAEIAALPYFDAETIIFNEAEVGTDNFAGLSADFDRATNVLKISKHVPYVGFLDTVGQCMTAPFSGFPKQG